MPALSSPYKASGVARTRSASPLPPPVPAKPIDLNSSTRSTDRETGAKISRRAFLCDVVIEREGEETDTLLQHLGKPMAPLSTLPAPASSTSLRPQTPSRSSGAMDEEENESLVAWTREKHAEMSQRLGNLIEELVRTERSYLLRIQALKKSYADPLRKFARDEMSKIIPLYEAKTLFCNIDAIVPAAAVFLADLEAMFDAGTGPTSVGDVCVRHLRDLRTLDPYRTYLSKQDESQKMFAEVVKKYSSFNSFIERTKYSTIGIGNIGLRELLMEPVQRIPRYTLLFQTMIKSLPPLSLQSTKLQECIEIASRIAKCEPDPQTVRATVMYCLERNVDGFPANLFSNNRDFIDSIDVDDMPVDDFTGSSLGSRLSRPTSVMSASTSASTPSLASFGSSASSTQMPISPHSNHPGSNAGLSPLHCTLFLFDDKLMIVKRQNSSISGKKVTGLDDVPKLVKSGGGVAVMDKNGGKKDKLSYRGVVNVSEVTVTDVGNGDFQVFFERPPFDQGERWSSRSYRSYSTVQPPFGATMDPVSIRRDKLRFLQNLWAAQAQARTKILPKEVDVKAVPRVMMSNEEVALDLAGESFGRAMCFWNVWDRPGWTDDKAKVAIHIDEDGLQPDLSLLEGDPSMVIRLQPMSGGLCGFSYATTTDDEEKRVIIDVADVYERIVTTIHRCGIFRFRTAVNSCPTTPSSTGHRLRPSLLNLDAISRNLFGQGSVSGRSQTSSEMFGTSSTRHKSIASRSSTMSTGRFSSSSDERPRVSRMSSSPSERIDEYDGLHSRPYDGCGIMGQSEVDLNERLNVARKNSKTMAALSPAKAKLGAKSVGELRKQVEEKEEETNIRGSKMAAKSIADLRRKGDEEVADDALREAVRSGSPTPLSTTTPLHVRNKTPSPTKALSTEYTPRPLPEPINIPRNPYANRDYETKLSRPHSASVEQVLSSKIPALLPKQLPRLPNVRAMSPVQQVISSVDAVLADTSDVFTSPRTMASPTVHSSAYMSTAPLSPRPHGPRGPAPRPQSSPKPAIGAAHTKLRIVSGSGRRISAGREMVPLKGGEDGTTQDPNVTPTIFLSKRQHSEDNFPPRKRSPPRSPLGPRDEQDSLVPEPMRKPSGSLKKSQSRRLSGHSTFRRTSGQHRRVSAGTVSIISQNTGASVTETAMPPIPVVAGHQTASLAVESAKKRIADSRSGVKRLKAEIHSLRKQLNAEAARPSSYNQSSLPRSPHRRNINRLADTASIFDDAPPSRMVNGKQELDAVLLDDTARSLAVMADKLDGVLRYALSDSEQAGTLTGQLAVRLSEREMAIKQLETQVVREKEGQELLRQQLSDVQVEVDVIYEAFNTELDGMFNDAQLPPTEAFEAMRKDLQATKSSRNDLALENMRLKRELEEANLKREQWSRILREKGVL